MNLCFVLSRFYPHYYGGMAQFVYGLANAMQDRDHQVRVLCVEQSASPNGDLITESRYKSLVVFRVWLGNLSQDPDAQIVKHNRCMGQAVKAFLAEQAIDVLHVSSFDGLTTSIVPAAHGLGVPVLYRASDYGTTCWRYLLVRWDGQLCEGHEELLHCLNCCRPWTARSESVYRLLAKMPDRARSRFLALASRWAYGMPWIVRRAAVLQERLTAHRHALFSVDKIVAPSRWMKAVFVKNGFPENRVVVSWTGVSPPPAEWRKIDSDVIRFGYVGRIDPLKGIDLLISAFAHLRERNGATLTIQGVPILESELCYAGKLWSLTKGTDGVYLGNGFDSDQVSRILQSIDVLVVPSTWYENSSRVILEALAHHIPVIISDVAGNLDHVIHDHNGLIFPNRDVDSLCRQMQRCISEPGLLARLTANASIVRTVEDQMAELEQYYCDLLQSKVSVTRR